MATLCGGIINHPALTELDIRENLIGQLGMHCLLHAVAARKSNGRLVVDPSGCSRHHEDVHAKPSSFTDELNFKDPRRSYDLDVSVPVQVRSPRLRG